VQRPDNEIDVGRGARARAAWARMHAPGGHGAGEDGSPYLDAPKDAAPDAYDDNADALSGPAATYPLSPAKLKEMQEEMRKYGTPPKEDSKP
jgi:hypothetical protein